MYATRALLIESREKESGRDGEKGRAGERERERERERAGETCQYMCRGGDGVMVIGRWGDGACYKL